MTWVWMSWRCYLAIWQLNKGCGWVHLQLFTLLPGVFDYWLMIIVPSFITDPSLTPSRLIVWNYWQQCGWLLTHSTNLYYSPPQPPHSVKLLTAMRMLPRRSIPEIMFNFSGELGSVSTVVATYCTVVAYHMTSIAELTLRLGNPLF